MEVYAAQIDRMDQGIGRVLKALRESGCDQDTLILFLADNGGRAEELGPKASGLHISEATRDGRPVRRDNNPAVMPGPDDTYQSYGLPWANTSNTPFRLYKHWAHEGGVPTRLIAYWPARIPQQGSLTNQLGHQIDIMATCADVGGATYPRERDGNAVTPLEGKPLMPIFSGKTRSGHSEIYWEHEGNRAVRQGKWKLISRHPDNWELYDLEADRTELHDLSASHSGKLRELAGKYDRWASKCHVEPWPLT